jgi:hypothetical protein
MVQGSRSAQGNSSQNPISKIIRAKWTGVLLSCKELMTWFEGKWVQMEDIMLSEISQAQKDKSCMFFLIYGR